MDLFGLDANNEIENLFSDQAPKVKQNTKTKKKNNKVDYATTMSSAIKTPFKCKNHQDAHMAFRQSIKTSVTCGSCGFKCEGRSGFVSCSKVINCFNLCSVCRICPKNHVLRNCISLKQFQDKSALYGENKFKCAGCDIEQKVGSQGVLHCPPCSFSVCIKCIKDYSQNWEKKMLKEENGQSQQKKQT